MTTVVSQPSSLTAAYRPSATTVTGSAASDGQPFQGRDGAPAPQDQGGTLKSAAWAAIAIPSSTA